MAATSTADTAARPSARVDSPVPSLTAVVLIRLAVGPATRADLVRDLKVLVEATDAANLRARIDLDITGATAAGLVTRMGTRQQATAAGLERAAASLGLSGPDDITALAGRGGWPALRDGALVVAALGGPVADRKLIKAVGSADTLRTLIVQTAHGLGLERPLSLGKLRTLLALEALERAFGHQVKTALGAGSGLAPKPSRLLAAQLLGGPTDARTHAQKDPRKDPGSDGRLIAALAAEHLGTATADLDALRTALLRRWILDLAHAGTPSAIAARGRPGHSAITGAAPPISPASVPALALATGPAPGPAPSPAAPPAPGPTRRPDLPGFVAAVRRAADARADGWPGNRRAFISHVWSEIQRRHAEWALSEIEFKAMLAEAHRTGGLMLAYADMKDARHAEDFEKSAIQYKTTVWHYVRVETP